MVDIFLWLESLTMEETFFLTYGCIFGLGLLAIPVVWWIDRKMNKEKMAMANEKRLIYAEAAKKAMECVAPLSVYRIDNVPTVDAVEVVQCISCGHYDEESEYCNFWNGVRHPEHFCGEGERKNK